MDADVQDLIDNLKAQKKAGAVIKPLSEAPADIQRMAEEDTKYIFPPKRKPPTPLWRVVGGGCFEYDNGEFGCRIHDVRLDVFFAFTSQLQLYDVAAQNDEPEKAFTALARAYALLYHRPRWWERWFRKIYFLSGNKARNKMICDMPARAIYTFLPEALAAYHSWVIGIKKKTPGAVSEATPVMPNSSSSPPKKPGDESEKS